MISLVDYLYNGDTVPKILHNYSRDLQEHAIREKSQVDMLHVGMLLQMTEILEHNDFLTSQSQRMREFYKFMAAEYPYMAFSFRGRIKSLIRAETKFNAYIVKTAFEYYQEHGWFPTELEVKQKPMTFRDIIAYRIILSLPKCHLKPGEDQEKMEIKLLYDIANILPDFLEVRGFTPEISGFRNEVKDIRLQETVEPYYRDYVANRTESGYRSLHITFYDNISRCYIEVQLRTKSMDDYAEIGPANHTGYEKRQQTERLRLDMVPKGECRYYDEALERQLELRRLDLSKLDVNMFSAADNSLINDACGLFRGRQILPFEHLSRFQNDKI